MLSPTYPPPTGLPNGAYHAAELALLFPDGTPGGSAVPPLDANQQVLSDQMTAQWTTFARTGNPTADGTPLWPSFNSGQRGVMTLQPSGDSHVVTVAEDSALHHCALWDRLPHPGD